MPLPLTSRQRRPGAFPATPRLIAVALASIFPALASAASGLTDLGRLNNGFYSSATGVSADGTVATGYAADGAAGNSGHAFIWTAAGGMVDLGTLSGGSWSGAYGISANGAVVVGTADDRNGNEVAFRWTQSGGMASLGFLNGGFYSNANAVSADGSVVVGAANGSNEAIQAFRWTQAGGMVGLGTLNGGITSEAYAVSADGQVVVGQSSNGATGRTEAFRWTQAAGMIGLGQLNGGHSSSATGISADGAVVVGEADIAAGPRAFRWTQDSGMVNLGTLHGGSISWANGISADGKVIVGASDDNTTIEALHGFRWTQAGGMQKVEDWLRAAGVAVVGNITRDATATNQDGSVVVGSLTNGDAYLARVSAAGSGLITNDYRPTLGAAAVAPGGKAFSDLVLWGAHHRPLLDSGLPAGNCAWFTGDLGHHNGSGSDQSLVEVGACHDVAPGVRLGLGVGQSWTRQPLDYGGKSKMDGKHLVLEADYAPNANLIASLSGYVARWQADIRRGYLNAGSQDASTGRPDMDVWAWRARVDWLDAASLGDWSMSPYTAYTETHSRVDAYTETGGGFPAAFAAQRMTARDVRLGATAKAPLSGTTNLRLSLEGVSRLDDGVSSISGQVLGPGGFGFAFAAPSERRTWARAGVEVDHRVTADTLLSVSLHTATQGRDASWVGSVNLKYSF